MSTGDILSLLMFVSFILLIFTGFPVAWVLGGLAVLFTAFGIILVLGIGVWLLSGTPGTLVGDESERFGVTPQSDGAAVVISVEEGDSASDIGEKLEQAGVIQSERHFTVLAALMGVGSSLEAGNYDFRLGETALIAVQRISPRER